MSWSKFTTTRLIVRQTTVFTLIAAFSSQCLTVSGSALQLGNTKAEAQNKSNRRTNSKVIPLLLASTREENPARAIELLKQAREEVKKEGLSPEDTARIIALIDDLERKAISRLELSKTAPPTGPTTSRFAGKLPTVTSLGEYTAEPNVKTNTIDQALAANPDVRDAMWEIGQSRLSRDTQNLNEIVKERTGQTVEQLDQSEADARADANKPTAFLEMLNGFDILKLDFTQANLKLKQEYSGVSLDIIADKLTNDATKFSFPVGVLKGTIGQIGPAFRIIGVPSEVIANFLINAKLVLRIADLYGIELADSEKQIVLFSVYSALKVGAQYGGKSGVAPGLMASFGQKLANLKYSGKVGELVAWIQKFTTNKAVLKVAGPALTGTLVTPADTAKANADAPTKTKLGSLRAIASRLNLLGLLTAGGQGLISASETQAMGQLAKMLFRSARNEKRMIHNEQFRRFLMTPIGEGFFKLLVLSMNDGRPSLEASENARSQNDLKVKSDFLLNIARSARVCSEEDLKKLADIKSHPGLEPAISYACKANSNTARSERLKNEFLTFDAIPQEYVADLRTVSRENRLRMAEIVIQMQFLDGDRSPSETRFFRSVVSKVLGADAAQDLEYFERLHAFIQESGGLVLASDTPTGVAIRSNAPGRPYDMERGYSPLNAPEPSPEVQTTKPSSQKE